MTDALLIDQLRAHTGEEIYVSGWFEITQREADVFAAVTGMTGAAPSNEADGSGAPVVSGVHLLSLLSSIHGLAGFPTVATEREYVVNYGVDHVRFLQPVCVGEPIRGRLSLIEVQARSPGRDLVRSEVTFESVRLKGQPHMTAEKLTLFAYGEAYSHRR
jgi:acyl dehydratase